MPRSRRGDTAETNNFSVWPIDDIRTVTMSTENYGLAVDLFRGACAVKGNVQVAGHVKPAPFSRRDVTLGDVDGSLFHIKI